MPWTLIVHPVKCQRGLHVSGLHVNLVSVEREREKKEGKIIRYFVVPIRSLTNVRINKSIINKSIYRLLQTRDDGKDHDWKN